MIQFYNKTFPHIHFIMYLQKKKGYQLFDYYKSPSCIWMLYTRGRKDSQQRIHNDVIRLGLHL